LSPRFLMSTRSRSTSPATPRPPGAPAGRRPFDGPTGALPPGTSGHGLAVLDDVTGLEHRPWLASCQTAAPAATRVGRSHGPRVRPRQCETVKETVATPIRFAGARGPGRSAAKKKR